MNTTIGKNQYYDLSADPVKNRIYLTLFGFWPNQSVVPDYINDVIKSTQHIKGGFTILTDLRKFKTVPPEVGALHQQAQTILVKAGLDRTAEVVPEEMVIEKITLDRYSKSTGMKKMTFHDVDEAIKWLDAS